MPDNWHIVDVIYMHLHVAVEIETSTKKYTPF